MLTPTVSQFHNNPHTFQFLSLGEAAQCSLACKDWSSLVNTMPSLRCTLTYWKFETIQQMCVSRLRYHVSTLEADLNRTWDEPGMSSELISLVTNSMPHLTSWDLKIEVPRPGEESDVSQIMPFTHINLPQKLVRFEFWSSYLDQAAMQVVLKAASQLPLLEHLGWSRMPKEVNFMPSFALLPSFPKLSSLFIFLPNLGYPNGWPTLTDEQIHHLHAIPNLVELRLPSLSTLLFRRLLIRPTSWRELTMIPEKLENTDLERIVSFLPSLTRLDTYDCRLYTNFDFLSHLPYLTDLQLAKFPSGSEQELVNGLCRCTHLHRLWLSESNLTCQHLKVLLSHLRSLETLRLADITLTSFKCFTHVVSPSLTDITLRGKTTTIPPMPSEELLHFTHLLGLQSLDIRNFFSQALPPEINSIFATPSTIFPQLDFCELH